MGNQYLSYPTVTEIFTDFSFIKYKNNFCQFLCFKIQRMEEVSFLFHYLFLVKGKLFSFTIILMEKTFVFLVRQVNRRAGNTCKLTSLQLPNNGMFTLPQSLYRKQKLLLKQQCLQSITTASMKVAITEDF